MKPSAAHTFFRLLAGVTCALLLVSCAQSPQTPGTPAKLTDVPVKTSTPIHQYSCISKIYLSEITKAFLIPADDSGEGNVIRVGEVLDKMVSDMFWLDTTNTGIKRVAPNVTLGFDRGTGVYRHPDGNGNLVQIRLQYQIFKPTGQSFSSSSFGQFPARKANQDSTVLALNQAMMQSLERLADGLVQTGVCKTMM
ncbi:MAG TPA: hypothetical protein PLF22_00795 [Pseudomonadales bacterium]|nr:hypothetical protein [Pseudomonadales bacterium]